MNKPHKHAELIKAWADGEKIQYHHQGKWLNCISPAWTADDIYRVKPEREYPVSTMKATDLKNLCTENMEFELHSDHFGSVITITLKKGTPGRDALTAIANAALRHAIDAGQVITAAEHQAGLDQLGRNLKGVAIEVGDASERREILDIDLTSLVASIG